MAVPHPRVELRLPVVWGCECHGLCHRGSLQGPEEDWEPPHCRPWTVSLLAERAEKLMCQLKGNVVPIKMALFREEDG